jgi:tRNA isopentenyl-2-thiomethyl-A-37 hydroxylase MiaE
VYKGTPLEHALQKIKELEQEDLPAKGQIKLFYTKLSDIWKNYFGDQLQVRSTQSTSGELMMLLSVYLQNEKNRTQFYQLLLLADAVKFAKYIPVTEQNSEAVKTTITSLQHIDALIKRATSHA